MILSNNGERETVMDKQNFVYVDANYLKELEETAKKVDYYKGIIDGINMVADRKTESNSEKPNNSTISKMEQVDKDINVRSKDEPQTELVNDSPILVKDLVDDEFNPYDEECMRCKHLKLKCEFIPTYCKFESRDEPQTERRE